MIADANHVLYLLALVEANLVYVVTNAVEGLDLQNRRVSDQVIVDADVEFLLRYGLDDTDESKSTYEVNGYCFGRHL